MMAAMATPALDLRRARDVLAAGACAAMLVGTPSLAAPPRALGAVAAPAPAPPAAASSTDTAGGDILAALIGALETRDRLRNEADQALQRAGQLARLGEDIDAGQQQFDELAREATVNLPSTAGQQQLLDVDGTLRLASAHMDDVVQELRDGTLALEQVLDHIRGESARWRERGAQVPEDSRELLDRMRQVQDELAEQAQRLRPQRDRLLTLLDRATELRARMSTLHADLVARRQRIAENLRTVQQVPIWQLFGTARWDSDTLKAERRLQWHSVGAYLREHAVWLLGVLMVVLLWSGYVLRRTRDLLTAQPAAERRSLSHTWEVLEHPHWAAVLLALVAVAVAAPSGGPVAFYDFGWLLVPIPAAVLALRVLGPGMRNLVWTLVAAVVLLPFRSLAELDPLIDRLKTALQLSLLIGALVWELARGYLPATFPPRLQKTFKWSGVVILLMLLVALAADIAGYVGLARTLRNGILGSLGFVMVLMALYHALHALGLGLLRTPLAQASRLIRRRRADLDHALDVVLRLLTAVAAALGLIASFGVGEQLPGTLEEMVTAHVRVGEAVLSIGSILAGVAILLVTWGVVVFLRLLLEDELLPRFHLKPGVPFAVSTLTRYTVAVVGFFFALAAAGIDLTKVTLLAGAIGVGVGLGLQNIVNNFISGLVLLVERPIHVGDTIEIGAVNGVVQRIGIRASVIRMGQGADAIVPNGDLLSKQVTNWTAWDRRRRVDIDLRAPFGAEPQLLIDLMQRLAAAHADVRKDPAPQALFIGFAESGLDFRLMAWVVDPDLAGNVASDLRTRLVAELASAGIALPLPQREVWMRGPDTGTEPRRPPADEG
jgi:small-conductance mechanosensitive channel